MAIGDTAETFEEYVQQLTDAGYIAENGTPLKCQHCDSKRFDEKTYREGPYAVEIEVFCKDCSRRVGHWAYGIWDVL